MIPQQLIERMKVPFAVMPTELLCTLQASIQSELEKRNSAAPMPAEATIIEMAKGNLLTGEYDEVRGIAGKITIRCVQLDIAGAIAGLSANINRLIRPYEDGAMQQHLELQESWCDLSDSIVESMMTESLSALVIHVIRKERDRRLQQSLNSQEAI